MKILVVDDHKLFLDGFCLLLKRLNEKTQITTSNNGRDALVKISDSNNYDLIILDISIPDIDGISLLNTIKEKNILSPVIFVSATENINQMALAMMAGASGFIPKDSETDSMIQAIEAVISGSHYVPEYLLSAIETEIDFIKKKSEKINSLTQRQQDVLRLMSLGSSNKEIAAGLFISEPTVKSHISVIFQTFQVSNRVECIRHAEKIGLI